MSAGPVSDHDAARRALGSAARRSAALLRAAGDGDRPVSGSDWSVGEVGSHLVMGLRGYRWALQGQGERVPDVSSFSTFPERLSAVTAAMLDLEPERDPAVLADLVVSAADEFLDASASVPEDHQLPTPWYGDGSGVSLRAATCLLLGEQMLHGYDIALTLGRPSPLTAADARLLAPAYCAMIPLAVDPARAAAVDMTCEIRLRGGGPRFVVAVGAGRVRVEPSPARASWQGFSQQLRKSLPRMARHRAVPVDCRLSADPVAFALIAYGRADQWSCIRRGQLAAWGRKPWKALQFRTLFADP